jgi:hypothetical protein
MRGVEYPPFGRMAFPGGEGAGKERLMMNTRWEEALA